MKLRSALPAAFLVLVTIATTEAAAPPHADGARIDRSTSSAGVEAVGLADNWCC